jgi:hypothetical protein
MGASDEEQPSKGFKVQDRRRFSAEGELKPEFASAEEPPVSPRPQGAAAASTDSGAARQAAQSPEDGGAAARHAEAQSPEDGGAAARHAEAQAAHAAHAAEARVAGGSGGHGAALAEINFSAFLMSLSTEALVHLGEMPDPASGEQQRDLAMAQQLIDILGMLRDKTRGNLDHDEQALLDAILFDLRMKYVEIARRAG